jgi:hypothetical protein
MSGFNLAFLNDVTDRALLASNDGKVVCLHDPLQVTQKLYRPSVHTRYVPVGGAAGAAPAKPMEKPTDTGK